MNHKAIDITLPMPISINQAYAGYPKRHKSNEYKKWEQLAQLELRKYTKYEITGNNWLEVNYKYLTPLYFKNGNKKTIDVFNYEKVLSDFLTHNIKGFEDHRIIRGTVEKLNSNKNIVLIKIWETKEN